MNTNPCIFLFIFLMLLMFLGAMNPLLTFFSVVFCIFVAFLISAYFASCESRSCCEGCVALLALQNFFIGVGAHLVGNCDSSLKYLTQIPFMTIALIWMGVAVNAGNAPASPHIRKSGKAFSLFAFTIALAFLIGRGNAQSILVTVRNLTVFYMAYEIGHRHLSGREFQKFQSFYFLFATVMLIAGIILLIGGFPLYQSIGVIEAYIAKGQSTISHTSLDGRFFSDIFNIPVSRMGSLYYEPVNLAYFFAAVFLIAWFAKGAKHTVSRSLRILISGTGLFLTFGKGGWLLVISTFLCVYGYRFLLSAFIGMSKKRAGRLVLGIGISAAAAFSVYYYKRVGGAVGNHFYGIAQGWGNALHRPFGYGLGTGGNMAAVFGASTSQGWFGSGGESALITYLFQLGFQGVFALALCMKRLSVPFGKGHAPKWIHPFHFLPLLLLFVSIFQENTFTPQCIVPFMFLQGGAVRNWENGNKDMRTLCVISYASAQYVEAIKRNGAEL